MRSLAATSIDPDGSPGEFPAGAPMRERLRFCLRSAILAPSTHNTQPWLFRLRQGGVDVFADPRRALAVIDGKRRQLLMSCGAAIFNLRVAMRRHGLLPDVIPFPDPDEPELCAFVRVGGVHSPTELDRELYSMIPRRRTNRQPFSARPVGYRVVDELIRIAAAEGATLTRLHPRAKQPLAEVISVADRAQFADRAFRRELTRWLVPSGSRRKDGIPFAKKEYGSSLPIGPMMVRTFDIGGKVAAKERELATGSPVLVLLSTAEDDAPAWLRAGQAMQAVLLRGCALRLSASFLNQPLELAPLRPTVAALAGDGGGHPQLLLRMGYGPPVTHATPRRPLDAVLLEQ